MKAKKTIRKPKTLGQEALSWLITILAALFIALPIRAFMFQFVRVDGHSMERTLSHDEIVFTTRYDYLFSDPERFDVVICRYENRTENFVKRVVGVPGDVVEMRGGYLYLNGVRCPEPYLTFRADYIFPPYQLNEGEYFVLGDNRVNSNDSHVFGAITREQIIAHVRHVVLPLERFRPIQ